MTLRHCIVVVFTLGAVVSTAAQDPAASVPAASNVVPHVIRFSGTAKDDSGKPITGILGVTFALYKDEQGGAPLWLETQNVEADSNGHFTVMLGATKPEGLPVELFTSGDARWLGVRTGEQEPARVLLVSVPYALKAHEAETLGGMPASAFVQANPAEASGASAGANKSSHSAKDSAVTPAIAGSGTTDFIPLWTGSSTLGNSLIYQTGGNIGVGTKTPKALLDVASASALGIQSTVPGTQAAVAGIATATTGGTTGVYGQSSDPTGNAVFGLNKAATGGVGVIGQSLATSGLVYGVQGAASSPTKGAAGVSGFESAKTGQVYGVNGSTNSTTQGAAGVNGYEGATTGYVFGVFGATPSSTNFSAGVSGNAQAKTGQVYGVVGVSNSATAGAAAVDGYEPSTTGAVYGVFGDAVSTGAGAAGVNGNEAATTGQVYGVKGSTNSTGTQAAGVFGFEGAATGLVAGVMGSTNSSSAGASGVNGYNGSATGSTAGVVGTSLSTSGFGVYGNAEATSGTAIGVYGQTSSTGGDAVAGISQATTGGNAGVYGQDSSPSGDGGFFANKSSTGGTGVTGVAYATSGEANGVFGQTSSSGGIGGVFTNLAGGSSLVIVGNGAGFAQVFSVDASGNVNVKGRLTKGSGSFKIDHPLDPANKYLSHSFVESPDMMNIYNGNVTTDKRGLATIVLPDYFEALNGDFRYQLTVIGQFAQAIVAQKIAGNRFVIHTSKPHVEVSWQVTGIRHDAYANAYRIPTEEMKSPQEQGHYLHPEVFGASDQLAIGAAIAVPSPAGGSK
jgi:hypothetical protein